MRSNTKGIIGMVAGAAAVGAALMFYKRKDGTTLGSHLLNSARDLSGNIGGYAASIKDRLLHNVKGPGGEPVYVDMYDRQFYENSEGQRIFLEQD